MATLGERIKERRLKLNLTQDQLAEMMGVTRAVLSSYESDRNVPPGNALGKLGDFLKVSVDYLLGRTDDPHQIYLNNESKMSAEEEQLLKKFMLNAETLLREKGNLQEKDVNHILRYMKWNFEEDLDKEKDK